MDTKKNKRYIVSAASLLAMALGIALITRANMGSVAMLCPAYVLSGMPGQTLTFGMLVILMHILFVAIECILLKSVSKVRILAQVASSVVFGIMLDVAMWLMQPMQWDSGMAGYAVRIVQVLAGTLIVGTGFCIHLKSDVMLSADGLAAAFAQVLGTRFSTVRFVCDVAVYLVAMVFCLFYYGNIQWNMLGPGTLLSFVGVFYIYHRFPKTLPWISKFLEGSGNAITDTDTVATYDAGDTFPLVITIARTHGSGGHEIGKVVADRLNIKFYDKEIISATASRLGMEPDDVSNTEQSYSLRNIGKSGSIFETQSRIIMDAARESCVIIGRCADYVLRDRPYCLNIFIRCDEDYAVTLIRNKDNLPESQAREVIRLKNAAREKHYNHYTGRQWKDPLHYDLVINSAKIGMESAVDIICNAVENILKEDR